MSFNVRNDCHPRLVAGEVEIERYRAAQLGVPQRVALEDIDPTNYLLCSAIQRIVLNGDTANPSWAYPMFRSTGEGFVLRAINCGGSRTGYAVAVFEEIA